DGGGGDFYHFSDILADGYANNIPLEENKFLPEPYTNTKVYLGMTCDLDNPGNSNLAVECRADIIDAINQGMLFTSYVGHAQADRWAVESLMDASVISQLTNADRLSIFLAMACYEG
ncbi:C25 family cysteine peptidase, partial [Arthrospira platensis SPKY2]